MGHREREGPVLHSLARRQLDPKPSPSLPRLQRREEVDPKPSPSLPRLQRTARRRRCCASHSRCWTRTRTSWRLRPRLDPRPRPPPLAQTASGPLQKFGTEGSTGKRSREHLPPTPPLPPIRRPFPGPRLAASSPSAPRSWCRLESQTGSSSSRRSPHIPPPTHPPIPRPSSSPFRRPGSPRDRRQAPTSSKRCGSRRDKPGLAEIGRGCPTQDPQTPTRLPHPTQGRHGGLARRTAEVHAAAARGHLGL